MKAFKMFKHQTKKPKGSAQAVGPKKKAHFSRKQNFGNQVRNEFYPNKRGVVATEDSTAVNHTKSTVNSRSIYVRNVNYSLSPFHLEEHFKECGNILRCTIPLNTKTRKTMGFGYIEFADEESAKRALEMHMTLLDKRFLEVEPKHSYHNAPWRTFAGIRYTLP